MYQTTLNGMSKNEIIVVRFRWRKNKTKVAAHRVRSTYSYEWINAIECVPVVNLDKNRTFKSGSIKSTQTWLLHKNCVIVPKQWEIHLNYLAWLYWFHIQRAWIDFNARRRAPFTLRTNMEYLSIFFTLNFHEEHVNYLQLQSCELLKTKETNFFLWLLHWLICYSLEVDHQKLYWIDNLMRITIIKSFVWRIVNCETLQWIFTHFLNHAEFVHNGSQ